VPPDLLRAGLRIAVLVLVLGLAMLPFQDRTKAEFYVSLLAAIIGGLYVLAIWLVSRQGMPRPPAATISHRDKTPRT
jgi:hypothetical protein